MGCSHCLEDATPAGEHMSLDLFKRALDFTARAECELINHGVEPVILLSGGECTDNPHVVEMLEEVSARGWLVLLLTHGLWLNNEELRKEILREERKIIVQVTNDSRYYPRKPPKVTHPKVHYVDKLLVLSTIGRAKGPKFDPKGLEERHAPASFNFRSITRSMGSVPRAIAVLRARALMGGSGMCTPSVSHDGTVVAGESRFCFPIGTVDSSNEELTKNVLAMGSCNRCGQEKNLVNPRYRAAIGID